MISEALRDNAACAVISPPSSPMTSSPVLVALSAAREPGINHRT
jgi:hypothetical protein